MINNKLKSLILLGVLNVFAIFKENSFAAVGGWGSPKNTQPKTSAKGFYGLGSPLIRNMARRGEKVLGVNFSGRFIDFRETDEVLKDNTFPGWKFIKLCRSFNAEGENGELKIWLRKTPQSTPLKNLKLNGYSLKNVSVDIDPKKVETNVTLTFKLLFSDGGESSEKPWTGQASSNSTLRTIDLTKSPTSNQEKQKNNKPIDSNPTNNLLNPPKTTNPFIDYLKLGAKPKNSSHGSSGTIKFKDDKNPSDRKKE